MAEGLPKLTVAIPAILIFVKDGVVICGRGDLGFLSQEDDQNVLKDFRRHGYTGRPLGDDKFIDSLEKITGRILRKQKPGPKKGLIK